MIFWKTSHSHNLHLEQNRTPSRIWHHGCSKPLLLGQIKIDSSQEIVIDARDYLI